MGHDRPVTNGVHRIDLPTFSYGFKKLTWELTTARLKLDLSKPVVANYWFAISLAA
jgi:hypothetical protein